MADCGTNQTLPDDLNLRNKQTFGNWFGLPQGPAPGPTFDVLPDSRATNWGSTMNEFEIWIDIVYGDEVMCTLFGRLHMPNRPIVGECISFHQDKSSSYEFKVQRSPPDFLQVNIVSAEIDEIGHYAVKKENAVIFNTSIRCNAIVVGSLECAKQIIKFLSSQFGFEIDPYGINKFSG